MVYCITSRRHPGYAVDSRLSRCLIHSYPKVPSSIKFLYIATPLIQKTWVWSGVVIVLGKLPVPGRPSNLIWIIEGQGPTALTVGAGGMVWTFFRSSIISFFFLPLSGRRPDID